MDQDQPKRIRRYASTIGILVLLAAVLGFYYFKYVPERRTEFNQAAFLELNQIEYALQNQNSAYQGALQNIINHDKVDIRAFANFNLRSTGNSKFGNNDNIGSGRFFFFEKKK
jgi:cbb3-type cytochrome oxidase subunit 3